MNAIQQISLKLQMGIDPDTPMEPERLRSMWSEQHAGHATVGASRPTQTRQFPSGTYHPRQFLRS